jgi:rhodanese-related sulfurtransferase
MTTPTSPNLSPSQLLEVQTSITPALLVDIRSRRSFRKHHIQGSHNIPFPLLLSQEWPDGDWIVLANDSSEAQEAIALLHESGYSRRLQWLEGGISHWRALDLPLAEVKQPIAQVSQEPFTLAALLGGAGVLLGLQVVPLPVLVIALGLLLGPALGTKVFNQGPKPQLKQLV